MDKGVIKKAGELVMNLVSLPFIAGAYLFAGMLELLCHFVSGKGEKTASTDNIVNYIRENKISTFLDILRPYKKRVCDSHYVKYKTYVECVLDFCFYDSSEKPHMIIDVPEKIYFRNCLFASDVEFVLEEKTDIEFSNCVFWGKAYVRTPKSPSETLLRLESCLINEINISMIEKVEIKYSVINSLILSTSPRKGIRLTRNVINHFHPLERISEKDERLFVGNVFKGRFCKLDRKTKEKQLIRFFKKSRIIREDSKDSENKGIATTKYNYYDALVRNSDNSLERGVYAKNLFYKKLNAASDLVSRFIIVMTGGFCFPLLFLAYFCIVVVACGFIYYFSAKGLDEPITILHAFYISVLTSMTIQSEGPDHFTKIVAVIQAGLSILSSGGFLTAVIKKYID